MKYFLFTTLLSFSILFSQSSLGGLPYSFSNEINSNTGLIETALVDREEMLLEDELRPANTPYRYGYIFDENYNFFEYASKTVLNDGNEVWRLDIISRGAEAISLEFIPFYLSDDAQLYIYNEDLSVVLGAYSSLNNNEDNVFSIPLLRGEMIHMELIIPQDSQEANNIIID